MTENYIKNICKDLGLTIERYDYSIRVLLKSFIGADLPGNLGKHSIEMFDIRWNKDKDEWFVWAFATDVTDGGLISMTLIFGNEIDLVAATHSMEMKLKKLKENYALEKIENDFN